MPKSKINIDQLGWLVPDWPAPTWVRACTTIRSGGVSEGNYASLNLAEHVGDIANHVTENRRRVFAALNTSATPLWLKQIHGNQVVDAAIATSGCEADASFVSLPGIICTVLTADCLPLLLSDGAGTKVAAIHAGWRGLLGGVIENAVHALNCPGQQLLAWLGPAIGSRAFEVGNEVREAFLNDDSQAVHAFEPSPSGRWLANIYALARQRLSRVNVSAVYGGHWCTMEDAKRFYSFRRDGVTGRMASLIWLDSH